MKIEIIKQFRLLEVGKQLDADREWSEDLIKRGYAKSLESDEKTEKEVEKPVKEKPVKEK